MSLRAGPPGPGGYVSLLPGPAEPHLVLGGAADVGPEVLLTIAHLSDLHLCDAQSPARLEFIDRWTDPDSPVLATLGELRTYRANELLTTQVAAAMVAAVNGVGTGPVGGAPLDLAIATGDATDNAQANELSWYLALLDGGEVQPDSGDPSRYEGVADEVGFDERYWHPESARPDLPRSRYGFPHVPGLLAAARRAFTSPGLAVPWLGVHGNHDEMVQGTWPGGVVAGAATTGSRKPVGLDVPWDDVVALHDGVYAAHPDALARLARLAAVTAREVTADPARRVVTRDEFVAAHHTATARPPGHGFGTSAYYRHDHGPRVTMLVLDTVNGHGGWQGSLDVAQFDWLAAELAAADAERRYVVLASHHPLESLVNDRTPAGAGRRVLGAEIAGLLARHPSVVLWLNGHLHRASITAHPTWWEVTAPSLVDWPQQGRVVELLRSPAGTLTVATTMIDHAGEAPWTGSTADVPALAGLARELAANHWQWREWPLAQHPRSGARDDRNVLLPLPDPWA